MQRVTIANLSTIFSASRARWALLPVCLALGGCGSSEQKSPDAVRPRVEVSLPVSEEVTDYEDYTGNTVSIPSVALRRG